MQCDKNANIYILSVSKVWRKNKIRLKKPTDGRNLRSAVNSNFLIHRIVYRWKTKFKISLLQDVAANKEMRRFSCVIYIWIGHFEKGQPPVQQHNIWPLFKITNVHFLSFLYIFSGWIKTANPLSVYHHIWLLRRVAWCSIKQYINGIECDLISNGIFQRS